jgi:hypothetical protein
MNRDLMKRQALYDLVWSVPIDRLAATFELSGNGMHKICRRHDIPTPSRGYWAKLRAGNRVERLPLPPLKPGEREWVVIAPPGTPYAREGRAWLDEQLALHGYGDDETKVREPVAPEFDADLHVLEWRTLKAMAAVRVKLAELRSGLHPTVAKALESDRLARETVWPIQRAVFRGKAPRRRLALANALMLALERAGHRAGVIDAEARVLGAVIHGRRVRVHLDSKVLRTKDDPSGRERLDVSVRGEERYSPTFEWRERRSFVPEAHLARICSGIVVAAELDRRDAEVRSYHELRRRWEEREREQRQREEAATRKARESLLGQVNANRQARKIREFVAAASRLGLCSPEFASWQTWALEEADRIDPLAAGERPWVDCRLTD